MTATSRTPAQRRVASLGLLGAAGLLALSACTNGGATGATAGSPAATAAGTSAATATPVAPGTPGGMDADAMATLRNAQGAEIGTATLTESDGAMHVEVDVRDQEAGFYGLHIHGTGLCEPNSAAPNSPGNRGDFLSAGGHLGVGEADHPDHAGDLPSLLVMENGQAHLSFRTDRVALNDLTDGDGAALMLHGGRDNFANIPERYAPGGPDEDTLNTGDAGNRLACGVIEAAG